MTERLVKDKYSVYFLQTHFDKWDEFLDEYTHQDIYYLDVEYDLIISLIGGELSIKRILNK